MKKPAISIQRSAFSTWRAVIDPVTLGLIALLALGAGVFGSSWKPFGFLKPKPPTEQLTQLQAQLEAAQLQAEQARKEKDAAVAAERAKLEAEVRAAQQDNLGTVTALAKVAPSHRTAEVKLASSMANRVSLKLAAAIGALPVAQQEAMIGLIDQALSDKQADVDEAVRKLAERDAEFAQVARERDTIKAQIPVLTAAVTKAEETTKATQTLVTAKTEEVKIFAAKADAKEREAGGFKAAAEKAFNWVLFIAGAWAFLAFVLPGIVKHLPEGSGLKTFLRSAAGLLTSPLLHLDASKKITELTTRLTTAPFPRS